MILPCDLIIFSHFLANIDPGPRHLSDRCRHLRGRAGALWFLRQLHLPIEARRLRIFVEINDPKWSNEKTTPGLLFGIGDEMRPSYVGIISYAMK